jgi:hypothetical protein
MGFAIKKSDGTYRAWNRNAKDDALLSGETWEELSSPPMMVQPKPQRDTDREDAQAKIDAVTADNSIPRAVRDALTAIKKILG